MLEDFSKILQTYDIVNSNGDYICLQCGNETQKGIVTLKTGEMLPECEECGETMWAKL